MERYNFSIWSYTRVANLTTSILMEYDRSTGTMRKVKNFEREYLRYSRKFYLVAGLLLSVILQTAWGSFPSLEKRVQNYLTVIFTCAFYAMMNEYRLNAKEFVQFFNSLNSFLTSNRGLGLRINLRFLEKMDLLFSQSCTFTTELVPIGFVYGLYWINPCQPAIAGYFLLWECRCSGESCDLESVWPWAFIWKHAVFLLNYWISLWTCHFMLMMVTIFFVLTTIMMRNAVTFFGDIAIEGHIPLQERIMIYRRIQLLNNLANHIMSNIVGLTLTGIYLMVGLALAMTVISLRTSRSLLTMITFATIGADAVSALLVLFPLLVAVHSESDDVFQRIKTHGITKGKLGRLEGRLEERFLRSCPYIKTKFGSDNFLEKLTPLKVLDSGLDLGISLMLMERDS